MSKEQIIDEPRLLYAFTREELKTAAPGDVISILDNVDWLILYVVSNDIVPDKLEEELIKISTTKSLKLDLNEIIKQAFINCLGEEGYLSLKNDFEIDRAEKLAQKVSQPIKNIIKKN